eukprot:3186768-Pyramimonas_sp.AAC.1
MQCFCCDRGARSHVPLREQGGQHLARLRPEVLALAPVAPLEGPRLVCQRAGVHLAAGAKMAPQAAPRA